MPTPAKPVAVLRAEQRTHYTKAALDARERGEAALLTGVSMTEWPATRAHPVAHRHFLRVVKLMKAIGKNDAIHEAVINRYCMLLAECEAIETDKQHIEVQQERIESQRLEGEITAESAAELDTQLIGQKLALDRQLMAKRKMLLDIEKENVMTVAAALRSVPKQPAEQTADPMDELFARKRGRA